MRYKYLLFDWDNCIAKTGENWHKALDSVAADHNISYTKEENKRALVDLITKQIHPFDSKANTGKLWEQIGEIVLELNKGVKLYPNAKTTLQTLSSSGARLAIVSTSQRGALFAGLEAHQLTDFFDVIISGDDVTRRKPSPEGIFQALNYLSAKVGKSLKVGDKDTDIIAAQKAGIDSILFVPPLNRTIYGESIAQFEASNPTFQIEDHLETLDIVGV